MEAKVSQKTGQDGVWRVRFTGRIDEVVQFPENVPGDVTMAQVDLGDVTYLNSAGIRNWVQWIGLVSKQKIGMTLERTPFSFIRSATMVRDILPPWISVKSFYMDRFCPQCETESTTLVDNKSDLPASKCPNCGAAMENEIAYASIFGSLKK